MVERLLRISDVCRTVGFGRSKVYALIRAKKFPAGIRVGWRTTVWSEAAVQSWVAGVCAEREGVVMRRPAESARRVAAE